MPHLATRTLHTTIGLLLRDVKFHYRDGCSDLRDSTIVQQDSGTGKKPAIEFVEEIARHLDFSVRRRSSITSAGAIGTLFEKKGGIFETQGDLRVFDLITCSEADSILYTPMDKFGNDLLTNLCESQDPNNVISKRLARGEITPFTSKSSLFLTTTIPTKINLR